MNRYILQPEDSIRLLPPESGEVGMIEVFCERTMIFFPLDTLAPLCLAHGVEGGDAYRLLARDALLGAQHELYLPVAHSGCAPLLRALSAAAPALLTGEEMDYVKLSCDHRGSKHAHA